MSRLRNVAVVLAGGTGTRLGHEIPKQLIRIGGKAIIEHTIATLQRSPDFDDIIVMMARGYLDEIHEIVRDGDYTKVSRVLEGAGSRNDTTAAAIAALGEDECNVILHDAVRPLVSQTIIAANIAALGDYEAVDTAIPSADTVIQVREDAAEIADVLPRHLLRRGQTPQSFRLSVLRAAYAKAGEDPDFTATDDCTVVLRYLPDVAIAVVVGHEKNMKVTEPIDVYIADKLFQLTSADQPEALTDAEYRSRLEGRTVVVFGGSYGIGGDIAELARSHGAIVKVFSRSTTNTHVERREDLVLAARQVIEETGAIDFVVNTAGVLPRGELAEASEEQVLQATDVNYLAPIYIAQEFYPHLAASKGSLLLFTSSSYTRGRSGYALYSSAKAAVVNLTQALADEWAPSGRFSAHWTCSSPSRPVTSSTSAERHTARSEPRPSRSGEVALGPGLVAELEPVGVELVDRVATGGGLHLGGRGAGGPGHLVLDDRGLLLGELGGLLGLLLHPRVVLHLGGCAHDLVVAFPAGLGAEHVARTCGGEQHQLVHRVSSLESCGWSESCVAPLRSALVRILRPSAMSLRSCFSCFLMFRVSRAGSWSSSSAWIPAWS